MADLMKIKGKNFFSQAHSYFLSFSSMKTEESRTAGEVLHTVRREHLVLPELKEVLTNRKQSTKWLEACQSEEPMAQLRELPVAKGGTTKQC